MKRIDRKDTALRNLKSWVVQVSDLEGKLIKREDLEGEIEVFDDWTFRKDVVVILASVLKQQFYGGCKLGLLDNLVLRLSMHQAKHHQDYYDET